MINRRADKRASPGKMDALIDLIRYVEGDDGFGGKTITRQLIETVHAMVPAGGGGEEWQQVQLRAQNRDLFVIRRRTDLVEGDIIVWDGHEYNIRYISPAARRDLYMTVEAESGVPT